MEFIPISYLRNHSVQGWIMFGKEWAWINILTAYTGFFKSCSKFCCQVFRYWKKNNNQVFHNLTRYYWSLINYNKGSVVFFMYLESVKVLTFGLTSICLWSTLYLGSCGLTSISLWRTLYLCLCIKRGLLFARTLRDSKRFPTLDSSSKSITGRSLFCKLFIFLFFIDTGLAKEVEAKVSLRSNSGDLFCLFLSMLKYEKMLL